MEHPTKELCTIKTTITCVLLHFCLVELQTGPLAAYYKLPLNRVLVVTSV